MKRIRIVLAFLAGVIFVTAIGLSFFAKQFPDLVVFAPSVAGAAPLPKLIVSMVKKDHGQTVTYLTGLVLALPLGLFCSGLSAYGIGLSAMSGMRW